MEQAQSLASINRLKEDEMKRLRNEKLEKIRNEMQQNPSSLQNTSKSNNDLSQQNLFKEPTSVDKRRSSPKFFGEVTIIDIYQV